MEHGFEVTIRVTNLDMLHNPTRKAIESLIDAYLREARRELISRAEDALHLGMEETGRG